MAIIKASQALAGANDTDVFQFDGGVIPGIRATDTFVASGPVSFSIGTLGTSLFSGVAQSLVATGGSASSLERTREFVAELARELVRSGIIRGNYSAG